MKELFGGESRYPMIRKFHPWVLHYWTPFQNISIRLYIHIQKLIIFFSSQQYPIFLYSFQFVPKFIFLVRWFLFCILLIFCLQEEQNNFLEPWWSTTRGIKKSFKALWLSARLAISKSLFTVVLKSSLRSLGGLVLNFSALIILSCMDGQQTNSTWATMFRPFVSIIQQVYFVEKEGM